MEFKTNKTIRSNKQIYQNAFISSINYKLLLDSTKLNFLEYTKLIRYLKPLRITLWDNIIEFYKVNQRKELKLIRSNNS